MFRTTSPLGSRFGPGPKCATHGPATSANRIAIVRCISGSGIVQCAAAEKRWAARATAASISTDDGPTERDLFGPDALTTRRVAGSGSTTATIPRNTAAESCPTLAAPGSGNGGVRELLAFQVSAAIRDRRSCDGGMPMASCRWSRIICVTHMAAVVALRLRSRSTRAAATSALGSRKSTRGFGDAEALRAEAPAAAAAVGRTPWGLPLAARAVLAAVATRGRLVEGRAGVRPYSTGGRCRGAATCWMYVQPVSRRRATLSISRTSSAPPLPACGSRRASHANTSPSATVIMRSDAARPSQSGSGHAVWSSGGAGMGSVTSRRRDLPSGTTADHQYVRDKNGCAVGPSARETFQMSKWRGWGRP